MKLVHLICWLAAALCLQGCVTRGTVGCAEFAWSDHFDDLTLLREKLEAKHIWCGVFVNDLGASSFSIDAKDFARARTMAVQIIGDNLLTVDIEMTTNGSGYEIFERGKKTGEEYF